MGNKKTIDESNFVEYTDNFKDCFYSIDDLRNLVSCFGEKEVKDVLYSLVLNATTGEELKLEGSKKSIYNTMLLKQKQRLNKYKKDKINKN